MIKHASQNDVTFLHFEVIIFKIFNFFPPTNTGNSFLNIWTNPPKDPKNLHNPLFKYKAIIALYDFGTM